jgi:hypothetical protein
MYTIRYRRLDGGCNSYIESWCSNKAEAVAKCRKLNNKPFTPFYFWAEKEGN